MGSGVSVVATVTATDMTPTERDGPRTTMYAACHNPCIPKGLMCDPVTQPYLANIAQVGGTYQQVFDMGDRILAVRTGGLEVFSRQSGTWASVSHLPLCGIPHLRSESDGLFADFRTSQLRLAIDTAGQVSATHSESGLPRHSESVAPCRSISEGDATYLLGERHGVVTVRMNDGSESAVMLPGYSRPSSIAVCQNRHELFVADVGAIHQIEMCGLRSTLTGGHYTAGWPKDITVDEHGVYCANVLGVSWYREIPTYPFIELVDRLSRIHFRVAKVVSRQGRVIACDEARGLHFFKTEGGKLVATGGLMLEGGAWDCELLGDQLVAATGNAGWISAPFDLASMTVGQPIRHQGGGRVQAVVPWKHANCFMVLSSEGIRLAHPDSEHVEDAFIERVCAWSGVEIEQHFVVAAGHDGVLLLRLEPSGGCKVVFRLETVEARDLCFDGQFVWVADGKGGVRCCHVDTSKSRIEHCGVFPVAGFSRGVLSTGKRIYVGAGDGGLVVLRMDSRGTT